MSFKRNSPLNKIIIGESSIYIVKINTQLVNNVINIIFYS